jgi:hypothetical protein
MKYNKKKNHPSTTISGRISQTNEFTIQQRFFIDLEKKDAKSSYIKQ